MTTTIDALPVPPTTSDPVNFDVRADAFLAALPTFRSQVNTVGAEMEALAATATTQAGIATTQAGISTTQAGIATTQAGIATASALTALNAPGTNATSSTSDTIALGSTTITIQTGKALVIGMYVLQARTSNPTDYMIGQITAYDSGTGSLTHNVLKINGSGTHSAWTISLSPEPDLSGASVPMGSILYTYNTFGGM